MDMNTSWVWYNNIMNNDGCDLWFMNIFSFFFYTWFCTRNVRRGRADVNPVRTGYLSCVEKTAFFFVGQTAHRETTSAAISKTLLWYARNVSPRGWCSKVWAPQARPLLGPSAPHIMYSAPLATTLFPDVAWIRNTWRSEGEPLHRGQYQRL